MFFYKKKYFLIIESIKDINLKEIKRYNKFILIYRNLAKKDDLEELKRFRNKCKIKKILFYVANKFNLAVYLKADGIYLSSYNKSFKALNFKKFNLSLIGSAHNWSEISIKLKQKCDFILLSKLFLVNYASKSPYLGLIKFNNYSNTIPNKLVALGGVKTENLNKLKKVNCEGFALLSEIKKKPAIIRRLF